MQARAIMWGNKPILFDTIKQNAKQKGSTEHIKHAKALAKSLA
jgi:hypothetical protein